MNISLIKILKTGLLFGIIAVSISCKKKKDDVTPETHDVSKRVYHAAFAVDPDGSSATYFQQIADFRSGVLSFENEGFQLHSTRTARPYSSPNGQFIFSYDYLGGQVYSYQAGAGGKSDYAVIDQINPTAAIGSNAARFTKVNNENCLLHIVTSDNTEEGIAKDDHGNFLRRKNKGSFINISTNASTGGLSMGAPAQFEILLDPQEAKSGVYISRIDAPTVSNGKVYYGFARSKINPATMEADRSYSPADAQILVMDYPSFNNPKIIRSDKAAGNTNGYRTPMAHVNESGDVYQMVSFNGKETKILKIKNGEFDAGYEFNLSALVGKKTISNGWFYTGNGIGYVPFADTDQATGGVNATNWYVARVDLNSNSAVVLNLPGNLWLQQYQNSLMVDGKFVMAIVPVNSDGNFYLFDPASTSPNGFEVGALINKGASGTAYIGVF